MVDHGLPDGVEVTRTEPLRRIGRGHRGCPALRAWSVQYHPEASPGPRDARYMFGEFVSIAGGRTCLMPTVNVAKRPTSTIMIIG